MDNFLQRLWSDMRSPEGVATIRFALRLFLILLAYYLMKPVREALILSDATSFFAGNKAVLRSIALACQAGLLLVLIPLYSNIIRRMHGDRLFNVVTLFLASNILLFFFMGGTMGFDISVAFFMWLGIFSVVQVSQFWSLVSDYHTVEMGKRLTAYIAVGGSLGAMIGAAIAKFLFMMLGVYGLMLVACGMLVVAVLVPGTDASLKRESFESRDDEAFKNLINGLRRVMSVTYLRWIATSVVMLNLINSTGEFILADFVTAEKHGDEIGQFYATFYLYVNIATLVLQAFVVRPLYRFIGVGGALISLAVFNLCMYMSVLAFPVLAWFAIVKMADNSIDYSVANTTKQILFLPLDRYTRYEGMLAINTFFTRFGDLIQGGLIYVVITLMGMSAIFLVGTNIGLCILWLLVTIKVSRKFNHGSKQAEEHGYAKV